MHPAIIQAIAADRSRDMQEHVAARRRAAKTRRSRLARRPWPLMRFPHARRRPGFVPTS